VRVQSTSEAETEQLGRRLGRLLVPGDLVALSGSLGAGKTVLARGIAQGAGGQGAVTSPTFTFIHLIRGSVPIYHVDLYRIDDPAELADLGLDEVLAAPAIVLIEWAEKVGRRYLPHEHLWISLCFTNGDERRELEFRPTGDRYERLLAAYAAELRQGA